MLANRSSGYCTLTGQGQLLTSRLLLQTKRLLLLVDALTITSTNYRALTSVCECRKVTRSTTPNPSYPVGGTYPGYWNSIQRLRTSPKKIFSSSQLCIRQNPFDYRVAYFIDQSSSARRFSRIVHFVEMFGSWLVSGCGWRETTSSSCSSVRGGASVLMVGIWILASWSRSNQLMPNTCFCIGRLLDSRLIGPLFARENHWKIIPDGINIYFVTF